jgi:hypothetical protein
MRVSGTSIKWIQKKTSKAVPLHAMVALGGRGGIPPIHFWPRHQTGLSGQRHAPAALCPGETTHSTHCAGDWVGPRAGLDTDGRGKIISFCRWSNPDRPVVQSVVRHYTDWATPDPIKWIQKGINTNDVIPEVTSCRYQFNHGSRQ